MHRPRIVVDTNVLVSAALNPSGIQSKLLKLISNGRVVLCASSEILGEYEGVLRRPKFKLNTERLDQLLDWGRQAALVVAPSVRLRVSPDEPDNRFLECAEAADADSLVTSNKKHFPDYWKRTRIVNVRELLDRLGAAAAL